MEPEIYRFRLKKYYQTIVKDLEPLKLVGFLYQDDIFDEDDMEEVRSERTRKRQAEQLLKMLSTRSVEGYQVLVKALEHTQPHLAKIMNTPVPNEKPSINLHSSGSKNSEQLNPSMEELTHMVRFIYGDMNYSSEPVEQNEPILQYRTTEGGLPLYSATYADHPINPTNFDLISPLYRPHLVDSVYKMTSSPRGLAVIINIMDFQPDSSKLCKHEEKLDKREGSQVDLRALHYLFQGLGLEVKPLENQKEDDLRKKLQEISKSDLSQYDCFVLCIMSHGKDDFFYCYDGGKIKISEIKKMFNNANCRSFCQKPKLFFIQACRGQLKDIGRTVSDAPSEHSEKESQGIQADTPTFQFKNDTKTGPSTSDNADILLAYSSVEGYTSYRNTEKGSRFINFLVCIFQEYAGVEDVESMMTRVINKVNQAGFVGEKQVPKPETTLTKKVFFWPGIQFSTSSNYY